MSTRHDSFLRTKWKPPAEQDYKENESNHEIDLNQIYGMTEVQTSMLRSMEGGRLKSQMIEGEEYPVFLFDQKTVQLKPEFKGLYTEDNFQRVFGNAPKEHKLHAFAVGLEHGNSTMGNTLMNTLFLREHNRIAGIISGAHPEWDDERVFQTTRNCMIVILIKIVLADYIYHISGAAVFADPGGFAEDEKWYRTNWMSVEFALLYRWHDLIPSSVTFDGETKDGSALRQNNRWLLKVGMEKTIQDASSQKAGVMGLGNTPDFLLPVRKISLHMARTCNLPSYVEYCKEYGQDVPKTFEDLTGEKETAAKLREIYGSVDKVEWFVGLFAQERFLFCGRLMTMMVGNDAVTQAFTNPLLARRVYNKETFSPEGFKIVAETSKLEQVVLRNTTIKDPTTVAFGFDRRD
jgi:prostaglandin-endoperoxide synthase 2